MLVYYEILVVRVGGPDAEKICRKIAYHSFSNLGPSTSRKVERNFLGTRLFLECSVLPFMHSEFVFKV